MTDFAKEIIGVSIEDELKQSYLDYAMSVIVGRALPDVRDGLKPVHRRVLYAMNELGNDYNKPYKKSARIVGDVVGKYHPHSDTAVYDALVRMAQDFSLRYLLVDGQGNFGSVDGDSPAAMRYTEVRMTRLTQALMADLDKETVDFVLNYDESETMPDVLPTRVPNLLVNGASGIAVGMATNIPPHNLSEIVDACIALIDNSELTVDELMQYVKGPDFPTAGIIHGNAGIVQAYRTGRGRVQVRARSMIETDERSRRESIVITELPYQVNKARLTEKIAELVKEKKIEGIAELRDESDKEGMRLVIELRRDGNAEVLLNRLYLHTQLQTVFGINMVALRRGRPQLMNLKQMLEAFVEHRREVVTRRTRFELRRARQRAHLLEGLGIALVNIDRIVALIKSAKNPAQAKEKLLAELWPPSAVQALIEEAGATAAGDDAQATEPATGLLTTGYRLSPQQAQAILDLRLHRLTGLEQDKIFDEYRQILKLIAELAAILSDHARLMAVIREELEKVRHQFGDARVTEIVAGDGDVLNAEDLIAEQEVAITLSRHGYAKTQPLDVYQAQHRGGKGKMATNVKDEDFIEKLIVANTHDMLLCFSTLGRLYWLKTYQIPQASRQARGRPLVNLLTLAENERINTILPIKSFDGEHYVVMATAKGVIKKVTLQSFSRPRTNGIIAVNLDEGDSLIGAAITDGQREIMLFADDGKAVRFPESAVRAMGRTARGIRGIKLGAGRSAVALIVLQEDGAVLTATANGYGKRTAVDEFRATNRGVQGVIAIQTSERNGALIAARQVQGNEEAMLISDRGTLVRIPVAEISRIGRNTQGVRLINLQAGEMLVGLETFDDQTGD